MLDEHMAAYAAARQNLHALSVTASAENGSWIRYDDLLTNLERLHDPDDLPRVTDPPAVSRTTFYEGARAALVVLRDHGFVDRLEASLLVGNLTAAWAQDPDRDAVVGR